MRICDKKLDERNHNKQTSTRLRIHYRILTAIILLFSCIPAALSEPQHPLFYPKKFYDVGPNGDVVSAEGALLGDGLETVVDKNNRVSITCFKMTKECWVVMIGAAENIVSDIIGPAAYQITDWDENVVISRGRFLCVEEIWTLDRVQHVVRFSRLLLYHDQYCRLRPVFLILGNPSPENSALK